MGEGKREKNGHFKKGVSGNPGGRPKDLARMRDLAREHTEAAIEALAGCLEDNSGMVRVAAAEALLNRAYGKPAQAVELSGPEGGPIELTGLENLSDAQLEQLERTLAAAAAVGGAPADSGGDPG